MFQAPEATVVIPTKDRWDLVSTAALPSALAQEDVALEVIVVDDGSRDPPPYAMAFLHEGRVRVLRHERPLGVASARNAGIREARGDWVAFLDDDDVWSPRKLRLQIDAASAAGATFAYGGAAAVAEDGSWLYSLPAVEPHRLVRALLRRNMLWGGSSNVVAHTAALRALEGFDERLFQICDWDLWIRLALTEVAVAVEEVVVGCRVHDRSMLLVSEGDVFEEFGYLCAKHAATSAEYGVQPDRRIFTRWVASGHRRAGRRLASARTYVRGVVRDGDATSLARAAVALVGRTPDPYASPRRLVARDGAEGGVSRAPDWLARYRDGPALSIAHATSKTSSPTES